MSSDPQWGPPIFLTSLELKKFGKQGSHLKNVFMGMFIVLFVRYQIIFFQVI